MSVVLPLLLYILGSILLVVLIILGVKLIQVVDRTNVILDDVEQKAKSLDVLFQAVDSVSNTISLLGDKMFDGVSGLIARIFSRRKKHKEEEDIYE